MRDIVYSEAEYSIFMTRIEAYSTFLAERIEKYQEILDYLMEKAIHDDQIRVKILRLKSDISLYTSQLETIRSETKTLLANMAKDFADADKMILPVMELSSFLSILSIFK